MRACLTPHLLCSLSPQVMLQDVAATVRKQSALRCYVVLLRALEVRARARACGCATRACPDAREHVQVIHPWMETDAKGRVGSATVRRPCGPPGGGGPHPKAP